ncbi:nucleoside 2-deoxyribosyltransferase [Psychrobacillus sp. FSL K6-4046]|uniref:nucleoside 2-deoxyribosyltransferase n=1 Tax=Psychrobacillus sp. FSL K6-4046 TaxID=2921550 RepID=UPI003159BDE6
MVNFYIASSFQNVQQVRELAELLRDKGWKHTYDWTKHHKADSLDCLSEIGKKEMKAVGESDILIVLLPAGKGSHIEMGIALGLGKRVFLYSSTNSIYDFSQTSTFYHVDGVERYVGDFHSFAQYVIMKNMEDSSI